MSGIYVALVERRFFTSVFRKLFSIKKKTNNFFIKVLGGIDKIVSVPFIYIFSRRIKVDENKILFITFRGEFDCNSKFIAQELLRRRLPYQIVWTIRKKVDLEQFPKALTLTYRQSVDFYKHLASAKIIVDNGVSTAFLGYKKKKNQKLVETWHGSLGIKKFSASTNKDKRWVATAYREGRMTDYIISNADFEDDIYREDFWKKTPIWQFGHARNDVLCEKDTWHLRNIRKKVLRGLELDTPEHEGARLCLYAPTFRDDGDMTPYKIDYDRLRRALEVRFGGEWIILTRFHFRLLKKLDKYKFPKEVVNASRYPDIYELLTCVDVGITDYSSWICDYMLTRRPGFLFATDMAEYEKKDRNFFYPLDTMPYPLALNNDQLIENILNFDNERFVPACDQFLEEKGCIDDGHASERIADAFEAIMRGETV